MCNSAGATQNAQDFTDDQNLVTARCDVKGMTWLYYFTSFPENEGQNCYAFSVNCAHPRGTNGIATPGGNGKNPVRKPYNAKALIQGCLDDGLVAPENNAVVDALPDVPRGHHLVGLYVQPSGGDYHFIRQGPAPFKWSNKPSANIGPVNAIPDDLAFKPFGTVPPAVIGGYEFVCYFTAPDAGLDLTRFDASAK